MLLPVMPWRDLILVSIILVSVLGLFIIIKLITFLTVVHSCKNQTVSMANSQTKDNEKVLLNIEGKLKQFSIILPLGILINCFFILRAFLLAYSGAILGYKLSGSYLPIQDWNWPEIWLFRYEITICLIVILFYSVIWLIMTHWKSNIIRKVRMHYLA